MFFPGRGSLSYGANSEGSESGLDSESDYESDFDTYEKGLRNLNSDTTTARDSPDIGVKKRENYPNQEIQRRISYERDGGNANLKADIDPARKPRALLELNDSLTTLGVQHDVDVPVIVVLGMQSSGKSSVIGSMCGHSLPRSSGTCTRCPFELRLKRNRTTWSCRVSLVFTHDASGEILSHTRRKNFGEVILDPTELNDRLERAQEAILSPSTDPDRFLRRSFSVSRTSGFSKNYVSIEIQGPEVPDLSFYDLPGLITNARDGRQSDVKLIEELLISYIEKPSCLILLTLSCESDFETQGVYPMVKKYDPNGDRTITVLTKPDRIPEGDETIWARFVKNEVESRSLGWFCVKQPSTTELKENISWKEAREREKLFFESVTPWKDFPEKYKNRLGTQNVVDCLHNSIVHLIEKSIPSLLGKIDQALYNTEEEIKEMPAPPSGDPTAGMLHLIFDFCGEVERHSIGLTDVEGMIQMINTKQEGFRCNILSTAPKFRPWNESDIEIFIDMDPPCTFLSGEEENPTVASHALTMHLDEVMHYLKKSRTRELPGSYSDEVAKQLIGRCMQTWEESSQKYLNDVEYELNKNMRSIVKEHFQHYEENGLLSLVQKQVDAQVRKYASLARDRVKWLLQLELQPCTLDIQKYNEYLDKFINYFTIYRINTQTANLGHTVNKSNYVSEVLSAYHRQGMSNVGVDDLSKLIKSADDDKVKPAIELMARVSAYYQVSCKRFIDYVIMAVDNVLVNGINHDLQTILRESLTNGESQRSCEEYLRESRMLSRQRDLLQSKYERLREARNKLHEII